MARSKDPNSRRSRAARKKAAREAAKALTMQDNGAPNARVIALRQRFAFVTPSKGPEGRVGTIDQDICDGIGQLHALGLLDGHGHDPQEMRDRAREWGHGYAMLLKGLAIRTANYERMDRGVRDSRYTKRDAAWDRMDGSLGGHEKSALLSLIVDPIIGDFAGEPVVPWAQAIIDGELLKRGKLPDLMRFADDHDMGLLAAAIRGMLQLVDSSLPARRNNLAA